MRARAGTGDFVSGEQENGAAVVGCIKPVQINTESGWNLGEATQTEFSAVQASVSGLRGQQGHCLKYSELQSSCPPPCLPCSEGRPRTQQAREKVRGQPAREEDRADRKQTGWPRALLGFVWALKSNHGGLLSRKPSENST